MSKEMISDGISAKIYIGPSFKGVISGTVFKGELSPALEEAIKDIPFIGELVVPVSKLVEANKELTYADSALSRFYKLAERDKKGE